VCMSVNGVKSGVDIKIINIEDARMCMHDRDRSKKVIHSNYMWAV
jgi:hypothetical protein